MRSSLWLASRPWIWSSSSRVAAAIASASVVGGREAGVDPFGDDELGLLDERRDHLGLGHDAHHLAAHEQVALAAAGGDAEVGVARLTGTVHHAAHHRDLQRDLARLERVLRLARDPDHVDLGAAARRARDEVEALALAQPHRLEQLTARLRLLDRVGGEREADRVADALGQQRGDPRGRLHQPTGERPGLGDAEVQRVVDGLREQAVRVDHHRHVRRLHRDLHVVEVDLGEVGELTLRRRDERLGRGAAVLLGDVGIERARVHPDADRDAAVLGLARDRP